MLFFQQNQFWLLFKYTMTLKTRNFQNPLRGNIRYHLLNEIVDQFWTEYTNNVAHKKKTICFFLGSSL